MCTGMGIFVGMGFPLESHCNGSGFDASNVNGNGNNNMGMACRIYMRIKRSVLAQQHAVIER